MKKYGKRHESTENSGAKRQQNGRRACQTVPQTTPSKSGGRDHLYTAPNELWQREGREIREKEKEREIIRGKGEVK